MGIALYMDVHVPKAITVGLRLRGVDVITAQDDESITLPDSELLERATRLGRAVVTFDSDFLSEAARRQTEWIDFGGVIYARLLRISVSECIRDLELIAKPGEPVDVITSRFLPF